MKKAIVKQLRKLAAELPPLQMLRETSTRLYGTDILKEFLERNPGKTVDECTTALGEQIEPDKWYTFKQKEPVPVNHLNNLKSLVKQHGPKAISQYVAEVNMVVKRHSQVLEENPKLLETPAEPKPTEDVAAIDQG